VFNYFGAEEEEKQKKFAQKRDDFLRGPVIFLSKIGIKPNHITLLSVILFFIAVGIVIEHPILGGVIGLFYCLLDGLDGPLARYQQIDSKGGSLIDMFADQVGVIVLPIISVIYFESNYIFAYIFGLFYIIEIFLLTILNHLKIEFGFVLRVKYPYYFLFLVCAYLQVDYLSIFYYIFGTYYLVHALFLYAKLIQFYNTSKYKEK